jgi:HrpA-like RNA helicase
VAEERGCELGEEVGYCVRFEDRSSSRTKVRYLTGG